MTSSFSLRVRYLSDQELDAASLELLRKFAKTSGRPVSPPIPVEEIIDKHLKVRLEFCDLRSKLGADVLGATWFDEAIIRVDSSLEQLEGRLCFTMAHETGHWVLHRPQYEADKVTGQLFKRDAAEGPPAVVCRSSDAKVRAEWQADQFAARLLMPESFVRSAFRKVAGAEPVYTEPDGQTRLGSLRELAAGVIATGRFSNVSKEAMRIRLVGLRLVSPLAQASRRLI